MQGGLPVPLQLYGQDPPSASGRGQGQLRRSCETGLAGNGHDPGKTPLVSLLAVEARRGTA